MLEDVPGALWTHGRIDAARVAAPPSELIRVVVAIDPAVTYNEDSNETGIVVVGVGPEPTRICPRRSVGPLLTGRMGATGRGRFSPL